MTMTYKLYETCQIGIYTPTSLINTIWYLNTLHFGIRSGWEEHRQFCWLTFSPNMTLQQNNHERTTKTRRPSGPKSSPEFYLKLT